MLAKQFTQAPIIVTRPGAGGVELVQRINAAGGQGILIPAQVFLPPPDPAGMTQLIAQLDQCNWLIFISPQAVASCAPAIHAQWQNFPASVRIAAVGAGTAAALAAANLPPAIFPAQDWQSEGVLALPELQVLAGQKIMLVRGVGGRELLASALTARGAKVIPLIAYQRALPTLDITKPLALLRAGGCAALICSSGEGLQNIMRLFAAAARALRSTSLVVISPRLAELAHDSGFSKIILAQNASHDAIISVLSTDFGATSQTRT